MKKGIFTKLGAVACVLTLVTTSLVGGTFAKYTSTVMGTGTAQVATWNIVFDQDGKTPNADYTFNLSSTDTTNVAKDRIVPGDKGTVALKINGSGSEVAYTYTITVDKSSLGDVAGKLEFYTDDTYTTPVSYEANKYIITDSVAVTAVDKPVEKNLYWKLAEDSANPNELAGKSGTFTVTMSAEQKVAEPANP